MAHAWPSSRNGRMWARTGSRGRGPCDIDRATPVPPSVEIDAAGDGCESRALDVSDFVQSYGSRLLSSLRGATQSESTCGVLTSMSTSTHTFSTVTSRATFDEDVGLVDDLDIDVHSGYIRMVFRIREETLHRGRVRQIRNHSHSLETPVSRISRSIDSESLAGLLPDMDFDSLLLFQTSFLTPGGLVCPAAAQTFLRRLFDTRLVKRARCHRDHRK